MKVFNRINLIKPIIKNEDSKLNFKEMQEWLEVGEVNLIRDIRQEVDENFKIGVSRLSYKYFARVIMINEDSYYARKFRELLLNGHFNNMDFLINKIYCSSNKTELQNNLNEYTKYIDSILEGIREEKYRLLSQIPLQE